MTAACLIAELDRRGVELKVVGDRLKFRPANRVPPGLEEALRVQKADVLSELRIAQVAKAVGGRVVAIARKGTQERERAGRPKMWPFGSLPIPLPGDLVGSGVLGAEPDAGPDVPEGWTRESWRHRLVYLAEECAKSNAELSRDYWTKVAALDGWAMRADALIGKMPAEFREGLREKYSERAAIAEFDAGLPLPDAERAAYEGLVRAIGEKTL